MLKSAKIVFAGGYGINSQGDDAPLLALFRELRKHVAMLDGVVAARPSVEDAYHKYGLRSVHNLEYDTKQESIGKWLKGFNYDDDRKEIYNLDKKIEDADLLIFGAGNAFNDMTFDLLRGSLSHVAVFFLMAKMAKVPVMLYGISGGPLESSYARRLARFLLELADIVTVRDSISASLFREIGYTGDLTVLPDPVLLVESPDKRLARSLPAWQQAHHDDRPVAAVAVRALPESIIPMTSWLELHASLCDELFSQKGLRPLFIPQCTYTRGNPQEDDRYVASLIVEKMKYGKEAVIADGDYTVDECLSLYFDAKLTLATRLHGAVFACLNSIPTVAFNYNPKVAGFMNWLEQPTQLISFENISLETALDKALQTYGSPWLGENAISRINTGKKEALGYVEQALSLLRKNF